MKLAKHQLTPEVLILRMRFLKHIRPEEKSLDKLIDSYKAKKRQLWSIKLLNQIANKLNVKPEERRKLMSIFSESDLQQLCQNSTVCYKQIKHSTTITLLLAKGLIQLLVKLFI